MQINLEDRLNQLPNNLESVKTSYPGLWHCVTEEWARSSSGNYAWLTYSANYLLACGDFKWAIDPFSMTNRIPGMGSLNYLRDLASLSLVVLTHEHNDHLDLELLSALDQAKIQWVIPEFLIEKVNNLLKIPQNNIILPVPGTQLHLDPIQLTPFNSLHFRDTNGVPETGYLIEFGNRRWLFPGDVRNYEFAKLPDFGKLDGVFAHLWLGKSCAQDETPQFLEDFCDFFSAFDTEKVIITHMYEYGRNVSNLWNEYHFDMVKTGLHKRKPNLIIEKALMGDRIVLNYLENSWRIGDDENLEIVD
jgi:hypothetical protein